ncbi:MAG: tetratricopeptide repeat protein, partial [Gammaproteobacteria bacterium]|nr:tetratricopeptide repeat protein [Gammaproteobacteria bacterium]
MSTQPSPPTLKARAAALVQSGRPAEARPLLEALCQQHAADAEAWYLLGTVYGLLGQHERGAECCQRALALRPRYPEAHNSLGNALAALGRIPEAETAYRAALKLNGRYADAQLNLAQVLHHQGRMAEAETQYR